MSTRLGLRRYARLVPLHSRDGYKSLGSKGQVDPRQVFVNGNPALEYDGLRNGELAWILGRRFKTMSPDTGTAGTLNTGAPPVGGTGTGIDELTDSQRYAHQAYAGLGNGVDRMQRLASTDWVESLVQSKLGTSKINLHAINLGSDYNKAIDTNLATYAPFLAGSTALYANDIARAMVVATGNAQAIAAVGAPQNQGILVAEMGPFLRGIQVSTDAVEVRDILGTTASQDVARNFGDTLCFSSLDAELRRRNLMDWTPDGIVLSKLESPTDEPMRSIEMDARSAQLFNVAIQGPAISTSWTSDVRDYKLECQPMDRVFICLVADLSYTMDTTNTMDPLVGAAQTAAAQVGVAIAALDAAKRVPGGAPGAVNAAQARVVAEVATANAAATNIGNAGNAGADSAYSTAYDALVAAKNAYEVAERNPAPTPPALKAALDAAQQAVDALLAPWSKTGTAALEREMVDYETKQNDIRTGAGYVRKAVLTNFRLMRSTSSHMVNYSHWKPGNAVSRLGLRLGQECGEYIVGAWCIGTVIDSAASRSTVGTLVRTAPTSMALNVAVNIEWWSGDKLYKHYMDDSGMTLMRGQHSTALLPRSAGVPGAAGAAAANRKRQRAAADLDVDAAAGAARGTREARREAEAEADDAEAAAEAAARRAAMGGGEAEFARAPGSSALPPSGRRAGGAHRR